MAQADPDPTGNAHKGKRFIVTVSLPALVRKIEVTGVNNPSEAVAEAMHGRGKELTSRFHGTVVYQVDEARE